MTTALITGITGMVGSHLADYLLEHTDWKICGMVRWRSPLGNIEHLVPAINAGERIEIVNGDLSDLASLARVIEHSRPDYVFHLAGQTFSKVSGALPEQVIDANMMGTLRLLEAIRLVDISPYIHVCSSSEVFGRVPADKVPIVEDCNFHPASIYAISKIGADLIGRFYAEAYDLRVQVTRMFTHTGPRRGDVFAESSFAKQIAMIEAGLTEPVIKVGNLSSQRTVADVRDAVRAYYMLLTVKPIPGAYYNMGGTHVCTVGDMLNTLISMSSMSGEIKVEQDPGRWRMIDADLQIPDTRKFNEHTGWVPEIPFERTMLDLLDYWRDRVAKHGNVYLTR